MRKTAPWILALLLMSRALALFAAMAVIWGIPYLLIRVAVAEVSPPVLDTWRSLKTARPHWSAGFAAIGALNVKYFTSLELPSIHAWLLEHAG